MPHPPRLPPTRIFLAFLALGLTSFGGPVAHIGYFRDAFVTRRRWLDERAYADLVALCQMLPGPTSSQVGVGIGLTRGGYAGALAAWLGFTAPSAVLMVGLGYGVLAWHDAIRPGLLAGLKAVVVAVVALAVWGMARALCPDAPRVTVAALAAAASLGIGGPEGQAGVIAGGALAGFLFLRDGAEARPGARGAAPAGAVPAVALVLFFALLVLLPVAAANWPSQGLALADSFYRSGALTFGGGHVVLPLLEAEVLPPGWVTRDAFLAGYGAAQALPGPLFTFAAYLGTVMEVPPSGWQGAAICLGAIFLPSFLLVAGTLPWWTALGRLEATRRAMPGINAAVVGLLLAALYDPVWTAGVRSADDFVLALAAFVMLAAWKAPPWLVVLLGAAAGWGMASFDTALRAYSG